MPEEEKKSGAGLWGIVGLLILAVIGYGVFNYTKKDSASELVENTGIAPLDLPETPSVPANRMYRDGTYTVEGNYTSPGGDEKIEVTLVLENDIITDVTVNPLATLPISVNMQGQFIAGVKEQVLGKKLNEVNLTKVSGSSLTPKGWNDAVAKIQAQAKV